MAAAYVNGWTIKHKKSKFKRMEAFVQLVKEFDGLPAINDHGYKNDLA